MTETQPWARSDRPGLPFFLTNHPACSYFSEGPFPLWLAFPFLSPKGG